jgi:prepilin-type N-terminal cleavage/methylation domain-containing protein
MLSKLRKSKKDQGFTIIEVLIVLAIAGLILLIVFLAVPALQRNSRNTQRKDDVSRIGSAVQEFINNNNGSTPDSTKPADITAVQNLLGTLAYYKSSNVTVVAAAATVSVADTDHVSVVPGAICKSDGAGGQVGTSTNATSRQVAVVYKAEAGSGDTNLCVSQ